ncbi:hypothetical protein DY000_02045760 [Brassica cretica]|uniref:Uncharacterized protein n=1 Tax=Brassica cretica TaxID=69181 RepID=A0ABQ7F3S5_BRACR|nr:hypothetical protein DY000_02045760 [Brassica cretica]
MEENLAEVMKGMSLGEDKSIIIPEDDDYCAIKSGGRNIFGRLLNPECQNMAIPPGFEPPATVVAPEVFEKMRIYMNCTDPDERNIREARMKKTLDDLSNDPIAQRSCLHLERAPTLSVEMNRSRGRIFDFSRVQEKSLADEAESSSHGLASERNNVGEACMKKTLDDLSNDPIAQRSCLRLERAPTLSVEMNRSRGRIFDFSRVQEKSLADEAESSSHGLASERNNVGSYLADKNLSREMIGTSEGQRGLIIDQDTWDFKVKVLRYLYKDVMELLELHYRRM